MAAEPEFSKARDGCRDYDEITAGGWTCVTSLYETRPSIDLEQTDLLVRIASGAQGRAQLRHGQLPLLKLHHIDPDQCVTSQGFPLSPPPGADESAVEAWKNEVLGPILSQLDCEKPQDWDLEALGVRVVPFKSKAEMHISSGNSSSLERSSRPRTFCQIPLYTSS